jgi:energy-coupling factor transport system permease protein
MDTKMSIEEIYFSKSSCIHHLNFWIKFLCFLIILPVSAFIGSIFTSITIAIYTIGILFLSRVELSLFWKQSRMFFIFLGIGLLTLSLFFSKGDQITRVATGLILWLQFIIMISLGILFSMVTDPVEIPIALIRIGIPHKYGVVLMVSYRMMSLISTKLSSIIVAQKTRGARFSFSPRRIPRLMSEFMSLMIPLVISTLETSIGLSDTLLSRGYDPDSKKFTVPNEHFYYWDFLLSLSSMGILIITIYFNTTR